ncbi:MAG: phosphotransferase [Verrucomicrobiota bacterium]
MNRQILRNDFPGFIFIDEMEPEALTVYLKRRRVEGLENVQVESKHPLGDGNMNITRLLKTNLGALVLKQSVPWVAKYPSINAPWDRSIREASFYHAVETIENVSSHMPRLLDIDLGNRTLLFLFEPNTQDCSDIYANPSSIRGEHAKAAAEWLGALHSSEMDSDQTPDITNRDMRSLNHEHIFDIPFRPNNGIDLDSITPGLQQVAEHLIEDGKLAKKARLLGEEYYLADGDTLLHGDYFPGSWLRRKSEILVIDPEFAFMGNPAFDLSVALAHFEMAGSPETIKETFVETYKNLASVNEPAVEALKGIEILRRILGVAQLPLKADFDYKKRLVEHARESVLAV